MKRLPMRKIRDVLRLSAEGLSTRQIAASLAIGRTTLRGYLDRARDAGLSWPLPPEMSDTDLERLIYPRTARDVSNRATLPDWAHVHRELRRKGVTLSLAVGGISRRSSGGLRLLPVLRALHAVGRQAVAGDAPAPSGGRAAVCRLRGAHDRRDRPQTGEVRTAQLFVATLGASSYTFAEATWTQSLPDWIASHVRAFGFFGG